MNEKEIIKLSTKIVYELNELRLSFLKENDITKNTTLDNLLKENNNNNNIFDINNTQYINQMFNHYNQSIIYEPYMPLNVSDTVAMYNDKPFNIYGLRILRNGTTLSNNKD